jgi:hypothetical protein
MLKVMALAGRLGRYPAPIGNNPPVRKTGLVRNELIRRCEMG